MDENSKMAGQGAVSVTRAADSTLLIRLSGPWHLTRDVPSASLLNRELESASALKTVSFDTSSLTHWDSGLIALLVQTSAACSARNIEQDRSGLPDGLKRLVELAEAVPEKKHPDRRSQVTVL
jgi:phospholipid/cholesterol/gamma-HCH transport system permease protein